LNDIGCAVGSTGGGVTIGGGGGAADITGVGAADITGVGAADIAGAGTDPAGAGNGAAVSCATKVGVEAASCGAADAVLPPIATPTPNTIAISERSDG